VTARTSRRVWTVRGHKRGGEGGTSEAARARERRRGVGEGAGSRGCVRVRACARESRDRRLETARLETAGVQRAGLEGRA